MDKYQNRYRIPSARAPWWDYARAGTYFITICTHNRQHYFGKMVETRFIASLPGQIAEKYWNAIPSKFPFVQLGAFIVIPNHIHGIITINDWYNDNYNHNGNGNGNGNVETRLIASLQMKQTQQIQQSIPHQPQQKTGGFTGNKNPMLNHNISRIIRWYKGVCTFNIRKIHTGFQWQPRFYDHIIRNEDDFQRIQDYIINNPANWVQDKFHNSCLNG